MKKTTLISSLMLAFTMLLTLNINAQDFPRMDKSPMDAAAFPTSYKESNKKIKIIYSRPQLNGRSLEKLAPEGEVWRTGANEAAEITLYEPMIVGKEARVEAGTYTFYLIPGKEEWTGIISSDLNVWGSYFYNKKNDIARFSIPATSDKDTLEAFSITFREAEEGATMHLGWGTVRLEIPFKSVPE